MGSHMVGSTGHIILKETLSIGSQKVRAVEHWTMGITIVLLTLQMMRCEQLSIPHLKGHLPMSSHYVGAADHTIGTLPCGLT
jgi:hypothetical protein